jgi:glycosyltransferase involved in cell wall biosynthesis
VKKILSILQLPPPIHGASLMNQLVLESKQISNEFQINHLQLSLSKNNFKENKIFKFLNFISLIYSLLKLKCSKFDIIYITPSVSGVSIIKDLLIVFVSKIIFKSNIVLHFHNFGLKENNYVPRIIKKYIFSNVTIILNSINLKSDIPNYLKNITIKYCQSCLPEKYNVINARRNPIPNILFYSNILKSKGILEFIEIIKKLENKIELTFTIAGDFYEYSEIELIEIIKNQKIISKYKILGKINKNEKEIIFSNADVYVNPSHFETFGITLLESLWFNTPVVCSNIGGTSDIINNNSNGFLIELYNIDSFVEAILKLLIDLDLYDRFVKNGNKLVKNKYQTQNFEMRLLKIFNEL